MAYACPLGSVLYTCILTYMIYSHWVYIGSSVVGPIRYIPLISPGNQVYRALNGLW